MRDFTGRAFRPASHPRRRPRESTPIPSRPPCAPGRTSFTDHAPGAVTEAPRSQEDAVNALSILVVTTDRRFLRAVVSLFEVDVEVRTAGNGIDCVRQLRDTTPNLLVLVPPVLWGTEAGVLAVMEEDPALRDVPVLVLPDPSKPDPTVAHFNPRSDLRKPHVARVVGRLCRCFRAHYSLGQFGAPVPRRLPALYAPRPPS
jgi:hypothetical protein